MLSLAYIKRTYYLLVSLFWLATALPAALHVLLMQARGINLLQIGLTMAIYSLTVVLFELPTGGLADALGRKRVTLLAYGFTTLFSVIFLFAFSFPIFLLSFAVYGIGRALASGALDAWFIDALQTADPEIDIQPPLAHAGTFSLAALAAGSLLGGVIATLFEWLPADGTAVLTPLAMPLLFALLIKVVLIAALTLLVKEQRPAAGLNAWRDAVRAVPAVVGEAITLSRRNPTLLSLMAITAVSGLAMAGIETFWQPHFASLLGDHEGSTFFFGLVLAGNFLLGMIGNLLATPLSRWLKQRYGLVAALFQGVQGLLLLLLALQTSTAAAVAAFWLVYLGLGVVNSPHATLVNRHIPATRRSSMLSVQSLASYAGAIAGSAGLGLVAQQFSISAAWIVAGVLTMLSLLLYLQIDRERNRQTGESMMHKEPATN